MTIKFSQKIFGNRLQSVIHMIVHEDRKGFIKGRQISHNLMELLTSIEYCNKYELPAFIMAVDFEKAFDKVEWPALK